MKIEHLYEDYSKEKAWWNEKAIHSIVALLLRHSSSFNTRLVEYLNIKKGEYEFRIYPSTPHGKIGTNADFFIFNQKNGHQIFWEFKNPKSKQARFTGKQTCLYSDQFLRNTAYDMKKNTLLITSEGLNNFHKKVKPGDEIEDIRNNKKKDESKSKVLSVQELEPGKLIVNLEVIKTTHAVNSGFHYSIEVIDMSFEVLREDLKIEESLREIDLNAYFNKVLCQKE